ncbi:tryptophan 2,3-dioxygenase [Coralliovum pocilloporae]|uniref:tryptophan 2,3-dioxygenase n=1 Tax=Coralliovum pocilloporae TaxID=3066369 RepID=UPI003306A5D3
MSRSSDTPSGTTPHPSGRPLKRDMEPEIRTEFQRGGDRQTYSDFLALDQLLNAQVTFQDPPQRDELMFIIIHQVAELWLKLIRSELEDCVDSLARQDLKRCDKALARVKAIQEQLISSWKVLQTMTVTDYVAFRHALGHSSGFQSWGYRLIEFALGNKDANHLKAHAHDPDATARLQAALEAPSVYDATLQMMKERGYAIPDDILSRDVSEPYSGDERMVAIWCDIYRSPDQDWALYSLAEKLMDVEGLFQRWRFDHMSTVERIIGHNKGTGGSSGVGYLKAALNLRFFHDLYDVRNAVVNAGP